MTDYSKYYRAYVYMQEILKPDFTHNYLERCMADSDTGKDLLTGKTNEKVIDMDWVIAIEDALPYLQKAIDEQRRFIKQVDNVVRVEKAKKITTDSVKHLAQHTNFIAKVEGDKVTPNKILNVEREESFEIYENRFLITLVNNTLRFVDNKYTNLKTAPTDSYNEIQMERHLVLNQQVVDFNINYTNKSHESLAEDLDVDVSTLSDFDRIRRIRRTLNDFLATPLLKALAKTTPVRPPIQQTNLLKKNPNFKKAVELWNFIESYKKDGFEIVGEEFSGAMPREVQQDLYMAMGFDHFMMSISTNPGLRRMLQAKYEEENQRLEEEKKKPVEELRKIVEAQIYARRQEEMEGYLKEIRDREKQIIDLKSNVNNLKMIIDQREQQIQVLRGQVSALRDQTERLEEELKDVKLKLLTAEQTIKEQKIIIAKQKNEIDQLTKEIEAYRERIECLEKEKVSLLQQKEHLTSENEKLKATVHAQEQTISELRVEITALHTAVADREQKIAQLSNEVSDKTEIIRVQEVKISRLTAENSDLSEALKTEKEQHIQDIASQKDSYECQIEQSKAFYDRSLQETKEKYIYEIKNTEASCNAQLESSKKDFEIQALSLQAKFDQEKKLFLKESEKQLETLKKHYEGRIAAAVKEKEKAYAVEERKFKAKLAKLERQMSSDYNRKVREIRAQSAKEVAAAKRKSKQDILSIKKKARAKLFTEEELRDIH